MSLGHVRQLLHKLLYCYKLWDLQQFKLGPKLKHKHGGLSLRCRHIHQMLYNAHLTVWDDFLDLVTDDTHSSSSGSCTHYHVYITCTVTISSNDNISLNYTSCTYSIPYNGNRPRKKSFANCLLCRSSRENFRDSGNLIHKNSGRDKKCKKTFANASRFAKFAKLFFRG